ncbi:hypothetical protein [Mangrovicoccus sp. HB161399]|uniref:hypothetical protein n=1 Tax=Mangrovicoccus sp. HB161399 TaxID=2720392 RepID=UPI0015567AAB|nr:hypothetical protein [Mangrovicoccus sp. HB161399]
MIKIVTFFLIGIAILAMFGRLRLPKLPRPPKGNSKLKAPRRCPRCGGFIVGSGPCNCEERDKS